MNDAPPDVTPLITLPWVARLRVGLAVAVATLVGVAQFGLGLDLPWIVMMAVAALIAVSNCVFAPRVRGRLTWISTSNLVGAVFVLDIVCLTVLLMWSGGAANPFSLLYLVHITLSATILTQRWTWFLGLIATLAFGSLFVVYRSVPALAMHQLEHGASLHLVGMWAAFAVAAFLVALFSGKISELMWRHQESLRAMQAELARKDRLASLVTLAAGAAHELGTPLGTIAVVAKDLETYAQAGTADAELVEDCRLIRSEVDRCRAILAGMSEAGAEPVGEALAHTTPARLLNDITQERDTARVDIVIEDDAAGAPLHLPVRAVRQAILALIKNAVQASSDASRVQLRARRTGAQVLIEVRDQGNGMSADQLRRVGEPFYTTKAPGAGMGLGVFLVRSLAERIGARLSYDSAPGAGTTVTLCIAMDEGRS